MSCRTITRFVLTLSLLAMAVAMLGPAQSAFAQVDNPNLVFQLDSNVVTDTSVCFVLTANGAFTATPSGSSCPSGFQLVTFVPSSFGANIPTDDWDLIASGTSHASATSFIGPSTSPAEAINSNADSIFTGGGSKDISGIASWAWKNGKPQGKDDIEHAFAAAYTLSGIVNGSPGTCGGTSGVACDTGIYFGMTRFDNSGDATAGFWFFQDGNVGLSGGSLNGNKDPICSVGSGCPFSGHHSNNDLLIVSDFSQGGPITSIQAFAWKCSGTGATCDSTGSLQPASSLLTANITCNPTTGASDFCAISNATAGLSVPFGFVNKSGQTTADHGEILEGGLDLNVIFPGGLPCFSTFMAETRSSNSPTATLSDLTPPVSFPLCGASITKACTGAQFVNDATTGATTVQYSFSGTVKNTGIGALSSVCVTDTPGANLVAGSVSVVQPPECTTGSLAPGATTTYSGTFRTTAASSTEGNTATVNAVSAIGGGAISPASASWIVSPATQLPNACQPAPGPLTIDKTCTVAIVPINNILELQVQFSGTVTNNSGVQVTSLSVTDDPSATITLGKTTLNNGGSTTYSGSYIPSACSTNDKGVCAFSDTVSAQGSGGASTGTISSSSVGATCHVCPPGACSTSP